LGKNPMDAEMLVRELGLLPHPEGGFFRETFRAEALPFALSGRGVRSASTAIYFLLSGAEFSAFHRVRSDEVWHHYAGDALELHSLDPARGHERVVLGSRIAEGERPQHVILAGQYQAARLTSPGYALCGCTVAPGFDFADFEMPPRAELTRLFPNEQTLIAALTRG
jgi:predicted cupin superfamily sugar epimerase